MHIPSKMIMYRRDFYKTKYMYLFDKRWNFFDKYNEIFGKGSETLRKINREIIYNKTFLKSEKKLIQNDAFIVFIKE